MEVLIQSVTNSVRRCSTFLFVALSVGGCRFGQIPNPAAKRPPANDPKALQERVGRVRESLEARVRQGTMNPGSMKRVLGDYIQGEINKIDLDRIDTRDIWRIADASRQSGDWNTTKALYELAVKYAPDDDRRVNDTIRLAEAVAMQGDAAKGVTLVRSTFDAKPGNKAPILMATLYEFVPAAMGKGQDLQIALLLEDAVDQHLQTVVDPKTEVGRAFLKSRRHHIQKALEVAIQILHQNGDEALMREALRRSDEALGRFTQA